MATAKRPPVRGFTEEQVDDAPNVVPWTPSQTGGYTDSRSEMGAALAEAERIRAGEAPSPEPGGFTVPGQSPRRVAGFLAHALNPFEADTNPSSLFGTAAPGGSNAVVQELLRPANYVGVGSGVRGLARGAATGVAGRVAADKASDALADAPEPVRLAGTILAGLAGGVAGFGAVDAAGPASRATGSKLREIGAALTERPASGYANSQDLINMGYSQSRGAISPRAISESPVRSTQLNSVLFPFPLRGKTKPVPPAGGAPPVADVFNKILPNGEKPATGVLRLYEGAVNTQGLEIKRDLDLGNRALAKLGIGKPTGVSRAVDRFAEGEDLFKALHGEAPAPARLQSLYDDLKASVDVETKATLDFDPHFMAHPDYFPRGWREVEVGNGTRQLTGGGRGVMGATPGFSKPRIDATFTEILDGTYTRPDGSMFKLEPSSWNPYEMLAQRRIAGAEFREQKVLMNRLRETGQAVAADGPLPDGWRVPRVGPAFEGKPMIAPPDATNTNASFFGFSGRMAVPDAVADVLENQYGRRVSLGRAPEAVLTALSGAKRVKLLGSLFQQVDFSTRTGASMFAGAIDDLAAGKPLSAVKKMARTPVEIGNLFRMNVSPQGRAALRDEILSGAPLFKERPGITLRGVSEGGWQQSDISILRRDISNTLNTVAASGKFGAAKNNLRRLEAVNERGLFDGVYPQAQTIALKNWILPRIMRQHPEWTDAQIMGNAATEVNKAFSTLGNFQTIFKNPFVNHLAHNLVFSTNESEALIRGAGSTFIGENKALWGEFYLGAALFLGTVANLVHMASTAITNGSPEALPLERYTPIKKDPRSPLGVNYNSSFLSPDVPFTGEGGRALALDLVGQLDTAFRLLDPMAFVKARESIGVRALHNQLTGRDFYDNPIDTLGPKGLVSRAVQAALDIGEPISAAQVRGAAGAVPPAHEPVGTLGSGIQAAGLNLRPLPATDQVASGKYEALSGRPQFEVLPAEAWRQISVVGGDAVAEYPTYARWRNAQIDGLTKEFILMGMLSGDARLKAEDEIAKTPIAKAYGQVKNQLESQWVLQNPKDAAKLLADEANLPWYERRFNPTNAEIAVIEASGR